MSQRLLRGPKQLASGVMHKKQKFNAVLDGLDLSFVVSLYSHDQATRVQDAVVVRAPQRAPPVITPVRGDEHVWVLGGQRIAYGACRRERGRTRAAD